MAKTEIKNFKECPACHGTNLVCGELIVRAKLAGLAKDDFTFALQEYKGVVADPARVAVSPIGTELPAVKVLVDVCWDCGCLVATQIVKGIGKKSLERPGGRNNPLFDPRNHRQ